MEEITREQLEGVMIHLEHPCFGFDIWNTDSINEEELAIEQGYMYLADVLNEILERVAEATTTENDAKILQVAFVQCC